MKRLGDTPTYIERGETVKNISLPGKLIVGLTITIGGMVGAAVCTTPLPHTVEKKETYANKEQKELAPEIQIDRIHAALYNVTSKQQTHKEIYESIEKIFDHFHDTLSEKKWTQIRDFCNEQNIHYSSKNISEDYFLALVKKERLTTQELHIFAAVLWQKMIPAKEPELR